MPFFALMRYLDEVGVEFDFGVSVDFVRSKQGDEAVGLGGAPDGVIRKVVAAVRIMEGFSGRERLVLPNGGFDLGDATIEPAGVIQLAVLSVGTVPQVFFGLGMERLAQFGALMAVMEGFNSLLEADGDEKADDDGGDVNEEVAPGMGGGVWRVNVE
jgi:hypothetical protein